MNTQQKPALYAFPNNLFFWEHEGKSYCIKIESDDTPLNPREDFDNIGTLFSCDRHNIGDKMTEKTPGAFWAKLLKECVPSETIIAWTRDNVPHHYKDAVDALSDTELLQQLLDYVEDRDEITLAQKISSGYVAWLPVWLYEHSGMTISCGKREYPFNDRFDSSAIGWIVMSKDTALDNLPNTTNDNWEDLAKEHMQSEIMTYDQYITGEVYGYTLYTRPDPNDHPEINWSYKNACTDADEWEEIDSCYGFFGADLYENGIPENIGCGLPEALASGQYETGEAKAYTVVHYDFVRHTKDTK